MFTLTYQLFLIVAFMSDETESTMSNDNNKPPSEVQAPIGVTEKIRRFLNHIHQLDLTSSPSSVSVKKKTTRVKGVTTPVKRTTTTTSNGVTASTGKKASSAAIIPSNTTIDFRLSRHSKCFLPWEPPTSPQTPRKSPKLTNKSCHRSSSKAENRPLSSSISSLNRKQGKITLSAEPKKSTTSSICDRLSCQSARLVRNRHTGSGMDINVMLPEKDGSGKKTGKSRKRTGSIGSIVSAVLSN